MERKSLLEQKESPFTKRQGGVSLFMLFATNDGLGNGRLAVGSLQPIKLWKIRQGAVMVGPIIFLGS